MGHTSDIAQRFEQRLSSMLDSMKQQQLSSIILDKRGILYTRRYAASSLVNIRLSREKQGCVHGHQ